MSFKKKETIIGLWESGQASQDTLKFRRFFLIFTFLFYFSIIVQAFLIYQNFVIWAIILIVLLAAGIAELALVQKPSVEIFYPQGIIILGLIFGNIYHNFLENDSLTLLFNVSSINIIDIFIGLVFALRFYILIGYYDLYKSDRRIQRPNTESMVSVNKFKEHRLLYPEFAKKINNDQYNKIFYSFFNLMKLILTTFTIVLILIILGVLIEIIRILLSSNVVTISSPTFYPFLVLISTILLSIVFLIYRYWGKK